MRLREYINGQWIPTCGKKRRHLDKIIKRGPNWAPPPCRRASTAVSKPPMNGARECARRRKHMYTSEYAGRSITS